MITRVYKSSKYVINIQMIIILKTMLFKNLKGKCFYLHHRNYFWTSHMIERVDWSLQAFVMHVQVLAEGRPNNIGLETVHPVRRHSNIHRSLQIDWCFRLKCRRRVWQMNRALLKVLRFKYVFKKILTRILLNQGFICEELTKATPWSKIDKSLSIMVS